MAHKRIPVKQIIAQVIRDLQIEDVSSVFDSFIEWSYEAERLIGSYDTFVRKECVVDVKNSRIRLPSDFYKFIALQFRGTFPEVTNRDFRLFGSTSPYLSNSKSYTFNSLTNYSMGNMESGNEPVKMTVEDGFIHVNASDLSGDEKAGLAYLAIALDDEGMPYIAEGHETAVTAYCMWKYKTADYVNGKIPQTVYNDLAQRWYWLCGQARGEDEMPNPKELDYIATIFQQLLPSPNKNLY